MSKHIITTFKCDFCGSETTDPRAWADWFGITVHPRPEHSESVDRYHACADCASSMFNVPVAELDEWRAAGL